MTTSYLQRLHQVYSTFHADLVAKDFAKAAKSWETMVHFTLELWDRDPTMSALMAGMSHHERFQFAGENNDQEGSAKIAELLDSKGR